MEKDRMKIRESEAKHIRRAYKDILEKGETVWAIAQKWNKQGIKTESMVRPRKSRIDGVVKPPPGVWTTTTVRGILLRPRNAGILMNDGAEMPVSLIEPIVTRQEWEALSASIKGAPSPKGAKPQYLLGAFLSALVDRPCMLRNPFLAERGRNTPIRFIGADFMVLINLRVTLRASCWSQMT